MADVSDPACVVSEAVYELRLSLYRLSIEEAYNAVRDDKNPMTWLMLSFKDEKSNVLQVESTGEGSLDEIQGLLNDDKASFIYARVTYSNDVESKREKFCLITWIGQNVKVMRKARLSVQKADVQKVLRTYSIEVPASSKEDLEEQAIVTKMRKAGGASYDRT